MALRNLVFILDSNLLKRLVLHFLLITNTKILTFEKYFHEVLCVDCLNFCIPSIYGHIESLILSWEIRNTKISLIINKLSI